jgi:mannose-6-phosphate isomerase-like protein (cupin superfamily)
MSEALLIKSAEAVPRGEGSSYAILNYLTKQNSPRVSVAVSNLDGRLPKTTNRVSDRVYYFIEGHVLFQSNSGVIEAGAGDVLFVPANTKYSLQGRFKAVLINSPAFDLVDEVALED